MNRYSNYSPSAYTPQTMEELAFVPLMKRQKHDQVLAQQELVRSGLAKVNPYDKHFNEAVQLKQGIESKMDQIASELAANGFNNDMVGKTIALNREYQDLVSPTGKIGQINAEKQNIMKLNEDYDKLGKEKGWSQETIQNHLNNALVDYNSKPVYDNNGRILKYTGAEDMANKIDYNKYLNELAVNAKMSTKEFSNAVAGLARDEASGYSVVNKHSYANKLGDNYAAVKAAYDTLHQSMQDPTSEVYKSMKYEGRDPKALLNILNTQSGVYKQSMNSTESSNDINPFGSGPGKTKDDGTNLEGITQSTQTIGQEPNQYDDLDKIGLDKSTQTGGGTQIIAGLGPVTGNNANFTKTGKKWTSADIQNPIVKMQYDTVYENLINSGKIKSSQSKDSKEVADIIKAEIRAQGPITVSTKVVVPDRDPNAYMFAGALATKDINERTNTIAADLVAGRRKMQDPENPEKMLTVKEFNERGYKVKYDSYLSPQNFEKNPFNNEAQNAVPHQVTVSKDGVRLGTALVERTREELNSPSGRASQELNKIFRKTVVIPNKDVNFTSNNLKQKGINSLKVKYVTRDPITNEVVQTPYYVVSVNGNTAVPYTEEKFIKTVYNTIGK